MGLDPNEKLVEGTAEAGIYTDQSGSYNVIYKGDKIGLYGADISSARKVLQEKSGRWKK